MFFIFSCIGCVAACVQLKHAGFSIVDTSSKASRSRQGRRVTSVHISNERPPLHRSSYHREHHLRIHRKSSLDGQSAHYIYCIFQNTLNTKQKCTLYFEMCNRTVSLRLSAFWSFEPDVNIFIKHFGPSNPIPYTYQLIYN